MMHWTGEDLAKASDGHWREGNMPTLVSGISTDSREFIAGHAFLALRGITFDGHAHAQQVAKQASALIGDVRGVQLWNALTTPQLQVDDTLQALGDIAAYHRQQLTDTKVVAITGSYGKTTVRAMIAHILLGLGFRVAATKANFNNLIGVPKTLLAVDAKSDVALIECGISERGEMARIAAMVKPDVVIMTGLTDAHSQGLGGFSGIVREKFELVKQLADQGLAVFGAGVNAHLLAHACRIGQRSIAMESDTAVGWSMHGQQVKLAFEGDCAEVMLPLPAAHWAEDMALAATVVLHMYPAQKLSAIGACLQSWQAVEGRLEVFPPSAEQPFTLIDDSYNANPVSMQAALNTLAKMQGQRIAILADMLELGDAAAYDHIQLDVKDIDEVWCVGDWMAEFAKATTHSKVRHFERLPALLHWLKQHGDDMAKSTVLVKGSHSMGLAQVVSVLRTRGAHAL